MSQGYHNQTAKFLSAVAQCMPDLSSERMQRWIENPAGLQMALVQLLEKSPFEIFKTIKLGTGLKTNDNFRKALEKGRFLVSQWACNMLEQPAFAASVFDKETEIDLVVMSVEQLGFKEATRRDEIYRKAQEMGLQLCPAEAGPQLRLQYRDQPKGEWLLIAMEPITVSDGDLYVFHVGHGDDGLWLHSYYSYPDDLWLPDYRWVFVCPRK